MRRMIAVVLALAAAGAAGAAGAAAQATGTTTFNAPYRAFTRAEFGALLSFPNGGGTAFEGAYRMASGKFDIGFKGGIFTPGGGASSVALLGVEARERVIDKTADKAGWIAGADATYWLASQPIGIRIEGSYSQTSEKSGVGPHKTKILGGGADVVYAFGQTASSARPYILAGLGYYNVKVSVTGASVSESKIGFGGGAGVAFKVGTGGTRVFVEGKYMSVSTSGTKTTFLPIRVGVRFGSK